MQLFNYLFCDFFLLFLWFLRFFFYFAAMIEIRRLEAAKYIAEVLAKSPNITWIPGGNTSNLINLRT